MRCEKCGISINVVPLYRNAPKGEAPHWRCFEDLDLEYKPEPDVFELVEIISKGGKE